MATLPALTLEGGALGAWLKERACAEGFDDAEVVPVSGLLDDAAHLDAAAARGYFEPFAWMTDTLDQRRDLRVRIPWARSVLVAVQSYDPGDHEDVVPAEELTESARVSRYAWGQDYHHVLRRKLRRLRKELLARAGQGRCAPFNDVDAVFERAWAKESGMGFVGKSAMFIHPRLGTYTFIGGLVTDLDLGPRARKQLPQMCGTCTACIDACPTAAIVRPGEVDARRCLVTWNVELPDDPRGEAPDLVGHGWAVGCDACQEVCPWNRFRSPTREPRYRARAGHVAFTPKTAPTDVEGTPLARPGQAALAQLAERALRKR